MMKELAIPKALQPFAGRILDVDTHISIPVQIWDKEFGDAMDALKALHLKAPPHQPIGLNYPGYERDDAPITAETVWTSKGPVAPSANDMTRRLAVMDFTGISRQLIFPFGVFAFGSMLYHFPPEFGFFNEYKGDKKALGRQLLDAINGWAIRTARISDRVRPVASLYGISVEELMTTTRRLLDAGIRAVVLPAAVLPGGKSPAHSDLDPFWQLLADRNVTATLHIGTESGFLRTEGWGDAPAFQGYKSNEEFSLSPWHLSRLHFPIQNFLATMVTGGVFERHPTLRFGCIELGSYWIGPMAAMLDMWHVNSQQFGGKQVNRLPHEPSYYINRNVRVSAFDFEHVDDYIDRYGLEDVYCYASDFPHVEGGKAPMTRFVGRLERFGPAIMEKFFVTNGALLLPP